MTRRKEVTDGLLSELADNGKLTDKQRDNMLQQHSDDLERIQKKYNDGKGKSFLPFSLV